MATKSGCQSRRRLTPRFNAESETSRSKCATPTIRSSVGPVPSHRNGMDECWHIGLVVLPPGAAR